MVICGGKPPIRHKGHPVPCTALETKARAEAWARQIENEMDREVFVFRKEAENTTLVAALERYTREISSQKSPEIGKSTLSAGGRPHLWPRAL